MRIKARGFTLIELLVVIAIIGMISTLAFIYVESARSRARDAQRLADLQTVIKAMSLFYAKNDSFLLPGTGSGGLGVGWLSYVGGTYPKSASQELIDQGLIDKSIIDPSGKIAGYNSKGTGYMFDSRNNQFTVWASLENPTPETLATQSSCASSAYDNYNSGANPYPQPRQMNYCLSLR